MFWKKKKTATMRLFGHGVFVEPVRTCRAMLFRSWLVLTRDGHDPPRAEITVRPGDDLGSRPAAKSKTNAAEYSFGPRGPSLHLESWVPKLEDVVEESGLLPQSPSDTNPKTWYVQAGGCVFELPAGVIVYSPSNEEEFPEVHVPGHADAFAIVKIVVRPLDEIQIRDPKRGEFLVPTPITGEDGSTVACTWETTYLHENEPWRQRFYAVVRLYGDDDAPVTVMLRAQAPKRLWNKMETLAETLLTSLWLE